MPFRPTPSLKEQYPGSTVYEGKALNTDSIAPPTNDELMRDKVVALAQLLQTDEPLARKLRRISPDSFRL